jgi:hypothetical protein
MAASERSESKETEKAGKKREDAIWLGAAAGVIGAWVGWLFVPATGIAQIAVALVVGAVCAFAGVLLSARVK